MKGKKQQANPEIQDENDPLAEEELVLPPAGGECACDGGFSTLAEQDLAAVVSETSGSEVEDPIAAAAKADAERAAKESAKRENATRNAKPARTKPEAKGGPARKTVETRKPVERKVAEKKPEAAKPEVRRWPQRAAEFFRPQ